METGKPVHIGSASAQTQRRMDIQAPLTAVYIHAVPALPPLPPLPPLPVQQPFPQARPTTATAAANAAREPATLHLAMPPLYSKETLPFLTLHIAGGVHAQPGLSLATAAAAPPVSARPKSAGKHVCPHCGRDCMKPSVLEKHLRCHTGERPYPCTTCGVSFKTQSNLYKHKRTQAHARQSSESELSSVDSASGSRETSGLSLDESGSVDKDATVEESQRPGSTDNSDQETLTLTSAGRPEKPAVSAGRHLPLQRQEATLFSKQWETSVSRGKSQSHESTDSGFSESSDHYPSPGSLLPDHSMDSLAESTKEHLEEIPQGLCPGAQEPKCSAATLEERISKLISQNSAVVEDKQLENVRPRKTVLSKQGSIDLPMPYTYKDSFHFDMRIGKTPNVGLQRARRPDYYSSVPAQRSGTVDHAPLTRSNSLPFSVALLQPERSSPTSPDYVTLARRGSSGQINPTGFAVKPANQHPSTHRPLVRQTAVDGNHATDGLSANSSVEEASAATAIATGSLSLDGDGGDICGEPSNRKFRRKKAQKFAYNKWYMYGGGGTFKKLYGGDDGKDRKCPANAEHEQPRRSAVHKETVTTMNFTSSSATACNAGGASVILKASQLHTSCSSLKTPLRRNLSLSVLPLSSVGSLASYKTDAESGRSIDGDPGSASQIRGAVHVPSDRKKQKTDDKMTSSLEMETNRHTAACPQPDANLSYSQINQKHALFPTCIINRKTTAPSAANFLPKYQLKLPNAEPQAVDKPADTQSKTAENQSENPNALSSAPHQLPLPRCGADAAPHTTSSRAAERLAATTTTTANFLQHDEAGSCTASIQASKSAGVSTPAQPPPAAAAAAPVVVQLPATPTAANNQSSAASSQCQPNPNPAPVHAPLSTVHSNAPVVPCNIVPDAHNVFHVHTADLQICLQIISDEQLALIEPQIERPAGSGVTVDTAAVAVASSSLDAAQGSIEAQESAATFTTKSQKAELGQSELSRSTQDTAFSDPHPHKHGGVNTAAVTQSSSGGVMESGTSVDEENVTLEVWSGQHELYVPPKHQLAPCEAAAVDANPNKLGLGAAELSESNLQVSLDSSSYANLEGSSQEVALSDDVITSTNSDKLNEKFTSHEERAKDVQTVAGSPTAALTERCGEQEVENVRRTEPENRGTGAQSLQDARRSKGEDGELNVDPARSQTLPAPCEHPQETPTQTCNLNTSQTHTNNVSHTHWETQTHNYDQTGSTSHHHHHQHEQKHRNDVATTSVHFLLPPEQLTTEPEPGGYHDDRDYNKYQSFFLSGQIHGYHAVDGVGVRPVQSCQDYTEDTSSSDDEGKLIIEL